LTPIVVDDNNIALGRARPTGRAAAKEEQRTGARRR